MRIVFASFDEVPSFKGASTHILAGLRGAIEKHSVYLATLGKVRLPSSPGFSHHPFHIQERNLLRRGLLFRARIQSLLDEIAPDLVHFRSPWEGIAAIKSGFPCIYEANGFPSIETAYHFKQTPERVVDILREWELLCLLKARKIIVPSERIRNFISTTFPAVDQTKIEYLPNGYDPLPEENLRVRHARKHGDKLRLVYIGTLTPWQGIFWLLRVLQRVKDICSLTIYAPPSKVFVRHLERRIRRYGLENTVELRTPLNRWELQRELPRYDLGVAPLLKTSRNTEQGCFPLKLLDYLSHDLPVLAPDIFVIRQLVTHNENGWLYAPGSALSCETALKTLAADPQKVEMLRAACRASLARQWNWKSYGDRLLKIYNEVGGSRRLARGL